VLGAVLGPSVVTRARNLFEHDFAGVFMLGALFHVLQLALLCPVRFPAVTPEPLDTTGARTIVDKAAVPAQSVWKTFFQPRCLAAVLASVMSFVLMMLIMSPTPLMMEHFGHSFEHAGFTMTGHMVLMFLPSPVTALVIKRCGPVAVIIAGCSVFALAGVAMCSTTSLVSFVFGLALLGAGWNCVFLAATVLLATSCESSQATKMQALSGGFESAVTMLSAILAAPIVDEFGWEGINFLVIILSVGTAVIVSALCAWGKVVHPVIKSPADKLDGVTVVAV